jgi:hypothetical protein
VTCIQQSIEANTEFDKVGNEIVNRAHPDGASNIQFVDKDSVFLGVGKVVQWDIFTGREGAQRVQVWRPVTDGADNTFQLICENLISAPSPHVDLSFMLPESEHCFFQLGDVIGWYHTAQGVTDYDNAGHDVHWHYGDHPGIGGQVTFDGGGARTYSIAATVAYCTQCDGVLPPGATEFQSTGADYVDSSIDAAALSFVGNPIQDRSTPDSASNIQFVDKSLVFAGVGRVIAWDIFTGRAGSQRLQIWRPVGAENSFSLVCENILVADVVDKDFHYQLEADDHCNVQAGDVVGWYHASQGVSTQGVPVGGTSHGRVIAYICLESLCVLE